MEKKGGLIVTGIIVLIIISALGIIIWQSREIINQDKTSNETNNTPEEIPNVIAKEKTSANKTNNVDNSSLNETNNTNKTSINETGKTDSSYIPSPTGSVTYVSRQDRGGEYFCNTTVEPQHAIRVYAYRIIDGTKTLSDRYIESKKISACDEYNNESATKGVTYAMDWSWDGVDGVDGYRIYQYYYLNANVSRNYSDSRDTKTNTLLDTGLNLWN